MTGIYADSATLALLEGIAEILTDRVPELSYRREAGYSDQEIGIYLDEAPANVQSVTLSLVPLDRHAVYTDYVDQLKIRIRVGTRVTLLWALIDATRAALTGQFPVLLSTGVYVSALTWAHGVRINTDSDKRRQWMDDYTVRHGAVRTA